MWLLIVQCLILLDVFGFQIGSATDPELARYGQYSTSFRDQLFNLLQPSIHCEKLSLRFKSASSQALEAYRQNQTESQNKEMESALAEILHGSPLSNPALCLAVAVGLDSFESAAELERQTRPDKPPEDEFAAFRNLVDSAIDARLRLHSDSPPFINPPIAIYTPLFSAAARQADELFVSYNPPWSKCPEKIHSACLAAFPVIYLFRAVPFLIKDKEAWAQRFFAAAAVVMQEGLVWGYGMLRVLHGLIRHANFASAVQLEAVHQQTIAIANSIRWRFYGALDSLSFRLRKFQVSHPSKLPAEERAAFLSDKYDRPPMVYVSGVSLDKRKLFLKNSLCRIWLEKWLDLVGWMVLIVQDHETMRACEGALGEISQNRAFCLKVDASYSFDAVKFLVLGELLEFGFDLVWVDFDVYPIADPSQFLAEGLSESTNRIESVASPTGSLLVPTLFMSDNLSPRCFAISSGDRTVSLLAEIAAWFISSPFAGSSAWDSLLGHIPAERFLARYSDNSTVSFLGREDSRVGVPVRLKVLDGRRSFGSGDGWMTGGTADLFLWSFAGADESKEVLFDCFFRLANCDLIEKYRKIPSAFVESTFVGLFPIVTISFASGCCARAQAWNFESALKAGATASVAYGADAIDSEFLEENRSILSQPIGAGYWLWKPHLILKTLKALPDGAVVVYLDAGNFFREGSGDQRKWKEGDLCSVLQGPGVVLCGDSSAPDDLLNASSSILHNFTKEVLRDTDVAAPLLKCCVESDWTKRDALLLLDGDKEPILSTPQLAAYFLIFRNSPVSRLFVQDWLHACRDPRILTDIPNVLGQEDYPTFVKHVHDQSVLSVLFKKAGFVPFDLDRAHQVIELARWRE